MRSNSCINGSAVDVSRQRAVGGAVQTGLFSGCFVHGENLLISEHVEAFLETESRLRN